MNSTAAIGTRFNYSGFLGTIRFIGDVDNTSGIWLGVEWDDPNRGKHDGVKDGKRYFTCRVQNAGSFIRQSPSISYGVSFLDALKAKYIDLPHESDAQEMYTLGSSNIQVEAVNLNKIRLKFANLGKLREISLDGENVAMGNTTGEILATCPNVRGLDLSKSLLPHWTALAAIVNELPLLQRLAVNRTRLALGSENELSSLFTSFQNLTDLQLNATMITWTEMQLISAAMPRLQVVEMGYNAISSAVRSASHAHTNIQQFNLDSNNFNDWAECATTLSVYPSLRRVVLSANQMETIPLPAEHELLYLGCLINLSLSHNLLNSWSDIDALSQWCPALQSLSIIGNPLTTTDALARYARPFVISKIPSLLTLDAAGISTKERRDCELFYLSYIIRHGPAADDQRVKEHPQWTNLCAKHGKPEGVALHGQVDKLSNHLININLYHKLKPLESPLTLRVLSTMALRVFRLKVCKSTKSARGSNVRLWMKMRDGELVEMLQDNNDSLDLSWWGLEDGSDLEYDIVPSL